MISLLNFIDTGFIITLGLLLLISGAVMLYCYRRLNILENSLIEHGKILQNFIINYNNQFLAVKENQLASFKSEFNTNLQNQNLSRNTISVSNEDWLDRLQNQNLSKNRISVSDDEDEDEDEDNYDETDDGETDDYENGETDDDEDKDDEDDEDDENNEDNVDKLSNNYDTGDENIIEESNDKDRKVDTENCNQQDLLLKNNSLDSKIEEFTEDVFLNNLPIDLNQLNLDSKIIKLEKLENDLEVKEKVNEKKNYTRMKVDELRTLVVTKNITSNEDAQLMKKSDLIKLLQ